MMNRGTMLGALAGALVPMTRAFADGGMSRISAYAFSFPALSGEDIRLAAYTGKPLLVVNTASLCDYTPQYAGLQELWDQFRERGLTVIGVPSNDFGGQEPGGASEISETAQPIRRFLPDHSQVRRDRIESAPLLQMGRRRAVARGSEVELPQTSDRP